MISNAAVNAVCRVKSCPNYAYRDNNMKLFGYQLSNLSFHKDVDHGPKEFPFYKLFVYSVIPVGEISYRLWVYTRWFAISLDVTPKE